jgi:hypothetical protein
MEKYQDIVWHELGASVYPDSWPCLTKLRTLKYSMMVTENSWQLNAQEEGLSSIKTDVPHMVEDLIWKNMPIPVYFEEKEHESGYIKPACNLCGNCISGCNKRAKNAVSTNFIALARVHGAENFMK